MLQPALQCMASLWGQPVRVLGRNWRVTGTRTGFRGPGMFSSECFDDLFARCSHLL